MSEERTPTGRIIRGQTLKQFFEQEKRACRDVEALRDLDLSGLEARIVSSLPLEDVQKLLNNVPGPSSAFRCPSCRCDMRLYGCFCAHDADAGRPQWDNWKACRDVA